MRGVVLTPFSPVWFAVQAELRKREAQRMDELEAAWRAKEIEREAAVNKAVSAHRQAESKLNQLLFDCEQRDQTLQLREVRSFLHGSSWDPKPWSSSGC
eukprot:SAG25_NODE_813_length_5233_cov_5.402805_2_plen_99_part_00